MRDLRVDADEDDEEEAAVLFEGQVQGFRHARIYCLISHTHTQNKKQKAERERHSASH